jgi:mRNA-degrading endonuclease YafQ of YafQ-DinJ toxin-antitoxin module
MRSLRTTKQFERDLRRVKRRRKDLDKLWAIVELLVLIWDETKENLTLTRTGTHADLFE